MRFMILIFFFVIISCWWKIAVIQQAISLVLNIKNSFSGLHNSGSVHFHCVKNLRIWKFSSPYFLAFGLLRMTFHLLLQNMFSREFARFFRGTSHFRDIEMFCFWEIMLMLKYVLNLIFLVDWDISFSGDWNTSIFGRLNYAIFGRLQYFNFREIEMCYFQEIEMCYFREIEMYYFLEIKILF